MYININENKNKKPHELMKKKVLFINFTLDSVYNKIFQISGRPYRETLINGFEP